VNKTEHLSQEFIHAQLDASQEAVEAALLAIYERQTAEERLHAFTHVENGVGFSKFDAEFCTSLCVQLQRGRKLTPRQLEVARRKTKRYWRQLITLLSTEVREPLVDAPVRVNASTPKPATPAHVPAAVREEASDAFMSW
jgi:hypothetical protein